MATSNRRRRQVSTPESQLTNSAISTLSLSHTCMFQTQAVKSKITLGSISGMKSTRGCLQLHQAPSIVPNTPALHPPRTIQIRVGPLRNSSCGRRGGRKGARRRTDDAAARVKQGVRRSIERGRASLAPDPPPPRWASVPRHLRGVTSPLS